MLSFQSNSEIQIKRAANGFIVIMPPPRPDTDETEAMMQRGMKLIKSMVKDDVLDKIREEQETEEEKPKKEKEILEATSNVHVFAKWPEVLAFLKEQIKLK